MSFSPNKRKSERSERVSLWWKWHIFWLREGLKCFYLSREGNTGILLLAMNSWHSSIMPGPESKHSIELGALPSKDTLKSPKNSKNSQNSVTLARTVDDNALHSFDWVRRRRVIRKQIKRPTRLSFSFATSVECFDSDPGINEFME